jgi:hypothetical protein
MPCLLFAFFRGSGGSSPLCYPLSLRDVVNIRQLQAATFHTLDRKLPQVDT